MRLSLGPGIPSIDLGKTRGMRESGRARRTMVLGGAEGARSKGGANWLTGLGGIN